MALQVGDAFNNGHTAIWRRERGQVNPLLILFLLFCGRLKMKQSGDRNFTITLQSQLIRDDIPIVEKTGIDFDYALVKGRSNYIRRRRFQELFKRNQQETTLKALSN